MPKQLICICCPQGCHLAAEKTEAGVMVSGNRCPRGKAYAEQEMTNPCRVVTAVVKTDNPDLPYLPVRTDAPLPKCHIAPLLNQLYAMTVHLPVQRGDVILANVANTGLNVVASENAQKTPPTET